MGEEVALNVVTMRSGFRPGDYVEFLARRINHTFTDTNVYWLSWGGQYGKRMTVRNGAVTGQGARLASFVGTARHEENLVMWGNTPGAPEQDYWFQEKLTAPAVKSYSLSLPALIPASEVPGSFGKIRVSFRGVSTASPSPDHHTRIRLNGTLVGDSYWDKDVGFVQEIEISQSLLREGANTVTVETPGDTGAVVDAVYLNWIEVDYWRRFQAEEDELTFSVIGEGRREIPITGLNSSTIRIYDITDPGNVGIIRNFAVAAAGAGYVATFEDDVAGGKTYLATTRSAARTPLSLESRQPANLRAASNQADYIVITPREFLAGVMPLCSFRENQGVNTLAVAVEDIYDEFNFGLVSPQAIKDFLEHAYTYWTRPAPTYVVLVGDANVDYRDYLGTGKKSRVPVHLSPTSGLLLTPDDNWYVAVAGTDSLPDMFIGRIPAATVEDVEDMVNKISNYEGVNSSVSREALFAADNNDLYFETINEKLIEYLPVGYVPQRVYLRSYAGVGAAKTDLIADINRGMALTNYTGHGDVTHWAGEGLLLPADIDLLDNGDRLTFVIALDCLNGYFVQPTYYSISESFVAAKGRGAIAAFSSSGLGYSWEHMILGKAIFSLVFEELIETLGEITTRSKIEAFANGVSGDLVKTFTLLGDPATRLKTGN